ncbi:MAG: ABC transporter ATP-binding protein [Halobacteriota archaeon]
MAAPIAVEGLTKRYGDFLAVEDVSFSVDSGEVFGFLGPNGAGKSTVIRSLLGHLRSESDRLELLGYDVTTEAELIEAKKQIGFIPSEFSPYENQTGNELLDYFHSVRGGSRREELAQVFDPPLDRPIEEYSTGNKQKLAFILSFMHDPELVVMDEPTAGLDPLMQQRVYEFIRTECANGATIFFSSHILSEVQQIADRVGIIRGGKMIALEDIHDLMRKSGKVVRVATEEPIDPEDFTFDGADNLVIDGDGVSGRPSARAEGDRIDAGAAPDVEETTAPDATTTDAIAGVGVRQVNETGGELIDAEGSTLEMVVTHNYDVLLKRLAEYTIVNVDIRETNLDDVFMHYYTDE